jgi:hypothetical protein
MRAAAVLAAAAALAASAGTATAAPRLQSPSLARIAAAPAVIADSTLAAPKASSLLARGAYWGGRYTTPSGDAVTVYVSDSYPQDQTIPQRWANFLSSLVHGSELGLVTAYLAPLDEVQTVCGADALACYSPRDSLLVAPGDAPTSDISAEAVVTHEYGHHIAAHRSDAPWAAVDYGTKRWASYMQVCRRTRAGELYPGAESIPNYELNPGEAFAETYRVLNQRRTGVMETPWDIVDQRFYPTPTALTLLEQDVTTPWTTPTTSAQRSSLSARVRIRSFSVATALDGTLSLAVRAAAGVRVRVHVATASGASVADRTIAASHASSVRTTICGQRSYRVRVARVRGAGAFTLTVTRP